MLSRFKVKQRFMLIIGLAVTVTGMITGYSIYGLSVSNDAIKSIYIDAMIPVAGLGKVEAGLANNDVYLKTALSDVSVESGELVIDKKAAKVATDKIEENIKIIDDLSVKHSAANATPEGELLAAKFLESSTKAVNELKLSAIALRSGNQEEAFRLSEKLSELNKVASGDLNKLIEFQLKATETEFQASVARYENIRNISFIILILAIVLLIWIGMIVTRSILSALGGEPEDIAKISGRIASGDLSSNIVVDANDSNSAMFAMNSLQTKVKLLVTDAVMLADAAKKGLLSTRADANQHKGEFRKVVEGVNQTLDDVVGPLNVAAGYVDRISKGDIPAKITDNYNGDFSNIKNNLNACIDAVNSMVAEANNLEIAAIEGRLTTRADASKYQGDFRKVVVGVNNCLDAVIGPLNVAAGYVDNFAKGTIPSKITDSYNGDFNILKNNLNDCIDALDLLVADANMLAQAAQDNKLDTRADATKHLGDYRKVVDGVNSTLDTVMEKNAADAVAKEKEAHVLQAAVDETKDIIQGAKDGDLTHRVSLEGKQGAIASLCEGVNALLDELTEVIIQVRESGNTINTAAGEISQGNINLSQRTEQQASSLEETAASMEELATTVRQNADNAKQANVLANTASQVAVKGGEVVAQVVNTMSAINSSAKKIEDIISVIDGIAFQTNILALNAAVEAARAGEQGRGFAVVAGEVRNLAQRSASAAKEIKELIADSVSKTAEGTRQVENAGSTMEEVVTSVKRVADIISEIAAASEQQSTGINQVNQAVTSMDEVTQQNAALVEQAAAAAESLVEQSTALVDAVSVFNVGKGNNRQVEKLKSRPVAILAIPKTSAKPAVVLAAPAKIKSAGHDGDWEEF